MYNYLKIVKIQLINMKGWKSWIRIIKKRTVSESALKL